MPRASRHRSRLLKNAFGVFQLCLPSGKIVAGLAEKLRPAQFVQRPAKRAGFGLLEALIAVLVVAIGVTALQRLVTRSIATLGEDLRLTRAMLAAQTLLADAALAPPEPGAASGATPDGLRFEREVTRAPHPALREVRVRVWPDAGAAPCELWEVIRVPPG